MRLFWQQGMSFGAAVAFRDFFHCDTSIEVYMLSFHAACLLELNNLISKLFCV